MARFALDEDFPETILDALRLAVIHQTLLRVVAVEEAGHDPIRGVGLLLVHLPHICQKTVRSAGQIWRLSAQNKNHEDPWAALLRIATHQSVNVQDLFRSNRLSREELQKSPLEN